MKVCITGVGYGMCAEMVANDLAQARQHALLKKYGYNVNVNVSVE